MTDNVVVTREALEALIDERIQRVKAMAVNTVLNKNHDYGDAWQRNGIFTPLMRIKEKLIRVETLSDGRQALVADESIDTDMEDVFNYSLLEMLKLQSIQYRGNDKPKYDPEDMIKLICQAVDAFNAVAEYRPEGAKEYFGLPKENFELPRSTEFAGLDLSAHGSYVTVIAAPVNEDGCVEVSVGQFMTKEAFMEHMKREGYRCTRIDFTK